MYLNGTMSSSDPFTGDYGIDWSAIDLDAAAASARGGGIAVASAPASSNGAKQPPNAKKTKVAGAAAPPMNPYSSAAAAADATGPRPFPIQRRQSRDPATGAAGTSHGFATAAAAAFGSAGRKRARVGGGKADASVSEEDSPAGVDLNTSTTTASTLDTTIDSEFSSNNAPDPLFDMLGQLLYGDAATDDRQVATKADAKSISTDIGGITKSLSAMSLKMEEIHNATVSHYAF